MKTKIRFTKYGTWILINFVFCLLPLFISAIISKSIDDNVITSYISFLYTLLISSLYVYTSTKKVNELVNYSGIFLIVCFIVFYILYPSILPKNITEYIRRNSLELSGIVLLIVFTFSLILSYRSLEEQVERLFNEKLQQRANGVEEKVKGMLETLKEEQI